MIYLPIWYCILWSFHKYLRDTIERTRFDRKRWLPLMEFFLFIRVSSTVSRRQKFLSSKNYMINVRKEKKSENDGWIIAIDIAWNMIYGKR